MSKFIPKEVRRKRSNKPLWWNKEIYKARKKQTEIVEQIQRNKDPPRLYNVEEAERKASRRSVKQRGNLREKWRITLHEIQSFSTSMLDHN